MAILTLALVLAAPVAAQDHSGLMPVDTPAVLRIESVDAAHAALTKLNELGSLDELPSKSDMLTMLLSMFDADLSQVDPSRPIYLGTQITMGPSMPTVVLPALDAAALSASVQGEATAVVRGDWVALSLQPGYAPDDVNPLVASMEPGVASVHLDLEALFEMFGGFIEMGLTQMEGAMLEELPPPDEMGGMDPAVMMEVYLDGFRTFMDAAESLDLGLHVEGDELAFHVVYTALEDSELANLLPPRPMPTTLPVTIDPEAPITFLMTGDWAGMIEVFDPWIQAIMEMYPAEMSGGLEAYMEGLTKAYALMGETAVGQGSFGADGMEFSFFADSPEPARFVELTNAALDGSATAFQGFGITFGGASVQEHDGISASVRALDLDFEKMTATFGGGYGAAAPEPEQMRAMLEAIYGKNPALAIAHHGNRVGLAMGDGEAALGPVVAGLKSEPMPAAPMLEGLRGLPTQAHPFVAYRFELNDLLQSMKPLMATLGEELPELPDQPMEIATWMALDGRRWMGGASLSGEDFKAFADAMK